MRHISREIGKVGMTELRASHVEHLRDALLARGLGPESVSGALRVLSQALARAEAKELVGRNWADASLVNRPAGRPADFTVVDANLGVRILRAATGTEWDAPVHLALGLGLRREEVLGLGWEHISDGVVSIRRTLTAAEGSFTLDLPSRLRDAGTCRSRTSWRAPSNATGSRRASASSPSASEIRTS